MNHTKTLMLTLLLTPAIALADQVTCESKDNKQVECAMNVSVRPTHLVRVRAA